MQLFAIKMKFSWNVSEKKVDQKLSFLAKGCVIEQNARKQTLLEIQFYFPAYPLGPILKLGNGMVCGLTFSHFYRVTFNLLPNFLIAVTHSVFNIIIIKCDTFKSNCWKWTVEKGRFQALRKGICGSQRCLQFQDLLMTLYIGSLYWGVYCIYRWDNPTFTWSDKIFRFQIEYLVSCILFYF